VALAQPGGDWGHRFQIAGVVGDTRYRKVRDPILPAAYLPYTAPWHVETFMVRLAPSEKRASPMVLAALLRQEVSHAKAVQASTCKAK